MSVETSVKVGGRPVRYDTIPGTSSWMRGAVEQWIERGRIDPDDFLFAVVTNDLREAVRRADDENIGLLVEWVRWFHNEAPSACWGSREAAAEWREIRVKGRGDCGGAEAAG